MGQPTQRTKRRDSQATRQARSGAREAQSGTKMAGVGPPSGGRCLPALVGQARSAARDRHRGRPAPSIATGKRPIARIAGDKPPIPPMALNTPPTTPDRHGVTYAILRLHVQLRAAGLGLAAGEAERLNRLGRRQRG